VVIFAKTNQVIMYGTYVKGSLQNENAKQHRINKRRDKAVVHGTGAAFPKLLIQRLWGLDVIRRCWRGIGGDEIQQ
jgi:hypothetical protein